MDNGMTWTGKYDAAGKPIHVPRESVGAGMGSGHAHVSGSAWVGGDAEVCGLSLVSGDAQVEGDKWETSPLYVAGPQHSLTNARFGHIILAKRCEKFRWWLSKEAKTFLKALSYTPAQIEECMEYVKLFIKVGR